MAENREKRSRSSNWTPVMKELLVETAKPHSKIIDSKLNDGKSLKLKFEAWQNIAETFKANGYDLTAKQIRDRWNRYKTDARANLSAFNRSQKETGGGTPPKEPSEIDYEIAEIIPIDFLEDTAEFDCDAFFEKENIPTKAKTPPPKENTPPAKHKPTVRTPKFGAKRRRLPTLLTSDELLKKRIHQIEMETEKKRNILMLKEKVQLKKLEVQERKLVLLNLKINAEEQNL